MNLRNIKISENLYNTVANEGTICENSLTIRLSENNIEDVTKDSILSASFKRGFVDNNLNIVTIELPSPQIVEVNKLIIALNEASSDEHLIVKNLNFNLEDYLNKITIAYSDRDETYEVLKDSELGKTILELSGLGEMINKTSKEIIDSIEL